MAKLTLRDLDVRGKRVLVRVDFNVPVETRAGKIRITDDTRIRESLPTINYLREHGAKTILMSHFGRPKGKRVDKYSLRPVGDYLHSLIHQPVIFSHDTIGEVPEKVINHMENGDVALLENVRFQPEEEANDPKFAEALAKLGDVYVNDAFGTAHRAKGVVHINIAEFRECFGKFRIIRFLFWLEPDGLKQSDIAVLHVVNDFFRNFPNRVVAENNGLTDEQV